MEKTTRDIYALINAQSILLESLFVEIGLEDVEMLQRVRDRIKERVHSGRTDLSPEVEKIHHQTIDAVNAFLLTVEAVARSHPARKNQLGSKD